MEYPIRHRTQLLDTLWHIQDTHGYIRDVDVTSICNTMGISEVDLNGVISFYHFFSKSPRGKYTIYLNNAPMSVNAGFRKVKQAFERSCGTRFGNVDPTGTFGLFETSCIGLSDQEPAALINFLPVTNLTPMKVHQIVEDLRQGKDLEEIWDKPLENIRYGPDEDHAVYFRPYEMGYALKKLPRMSPDDILNEMEQAGLRGQGGAFFPAHIKWRSCRQQEDDKKFIICNADEGEPGTFKDRVLMSTMPGLLLEGMIVAGRAVGADEGVIYLRAEYRYLQGQLQETIDYFTSQGFLGNNIAGIPGFDFHIRIQLGAGAYVCGEETALIASMEGKRGEPSAKIYFPVERGYLDKPTVVNNVETFCAAARIVTLGSPFFQRLGTEESKGTKVLSISGDCSAPGIYEIEWGMSLNEMLELCGAEDPFAVQLSGPSGYLASMSDRYRRLSIEDLRCGGSVMIFNSSRDLLRILLNYSRFFMHESCGICTPCRAGNYILNRQLHKVQNGLADRSDLYKLRNWGQIMRFSSRCGLGQTAPNPIIDAINNFPQYFEKTVKGVDVSMNKAFDLEAATHAYDEAVRKNDSYGES